MASEEVYVPLLGLLLRYMDVNLLNPLRYSFKIKVINIFTIFCLTFYVIWYVFGFVSRWVDINSISEANLIPAGIVALMKGVALIHYRIELKEGLLLLKHFWKPNKFPEYEKQLIRMHRIAYATVITFFALSHVLSIPAMFSAIFQRNPRELPIKIYPICDLETSPCYEFLYAYLLIYCYYQFVPIHLCFDGLFVATIAYIYVGMELIKISLKKLDFELLSEAETLHLLREIILQHELILRFTKQIRHVFTFPLLGFFLLTGATQIVVFYMLTADGIPPDMDHIVQYGSIIMIFTIQMLYYSISAALIQKQIQSVGISIYNVNWYSKTYGKVREYLAFMMQRTQMDESFTIGNVTKLNLETFVIAFRNIFSFYTLLSETSKKGLTEMS